MGGSDGLVNIRPLIRPLIPQSSTQLGVTIGNQTGAFPGHGHPNILLLVVLAQLEHCEHGKPNPAHPRGPSTKL